MNREEEILKMHRVLIKRRDFLRKALAEDFFSLKELNAQTSDDMVEINSLRDELSWQLAEVESLELSRIEYALKRMSEGQFGICEHCGNNIPLARLNALPYATYCIMCQREAERQVAKSTTKAGSSRLLDLYDGDIEPDNWLDDHAP